MITKETDVTKKMTSRGSGHSVHADKPPEHSRIKGLGKGASTVVLSVNIGNLQTTILNQLLI